MQIIRNEFSKTPYGKVALSVAQALGKEDFAAVYALLTPESQQESSTSDLESMYRQSIAYEEDCPLIELEVMATLEDWPDKQSNDLGWAYVAINMTEYGEAIAVVVTKDLLVRHIEWGRP